MLLIDAVYLNSGGGKKLLRILINKILELDIDTFFLLDQRLIKEYPDLKNALFLKPSLLQRHFFYLKNKKSFSNILCFSNIPPTIKLDINVYTYFHNLLLIKNSGFSFKLKKLVIKFFKKNSNNWIVQTSNMKKNIIKGLSIKESKILSLPFFEELHFARKKSNLKFNNKRFLYVSTGEKHKNHFNLIKAFNKLSLKEPEATLTLTIPENFSDLNDFINKSKANGSKIINRGFISKNSLVDEYLKSNIFIFPSLSESFGLGLIEAVQYKLPIICSNLPYVYDILEPSSVFNPYDDNSIYKTMLNFDLESSNKKSHLKINNKLDELIKILRSN